MIVTKIKSCARQCAAIKLGLDNGQVIDFVDIEGELAKTWADLVEYLSSHGVKHIYYVKFTLEKPKSRLREGDNAWIRYSLS